MSVRACIHIRAHAHISLCLRVCIDVYVNIRVYIKFFFKCCSTMRPFVKIDGMYKDKQCDSFDMLLKFTQF